MSAELRSGPRRQATLKGAQRGAAGAEDEYVFHQISPQILKWFEHRATWLRTVTTPLVDKRAGHLKTVAMSASTASNDPSSPHLARLLAIDFGERRTGTALVDLQLGIATPLETITRSSDAQLIEELERLRRRHHANGWILGLPLLLDGTEGDAAYRVRSFGAKLADATDHDPFLVSETLTSNEARRRLGATARRRPEKIDAVAAQIVGEQYLSGRAEDSDAGASR